MNEHRSGLTWWLRKAPKASKFRLHTPEGVREIVVASLPKARWNAACEIITATGTTRVEALDEKGGLLRVTDVQGDGEPPEDAPSEASQQAEVAKTTSDAATLQLFARLIAEAYQKGAALQKDAMSDLVRALTQRTDEIKKEKGAVPAAAAQAGGLDLDSLMQLANAVPAIKNAVDAMRGAAAPPAPPPKPNGVPS